MNNADVLKNIDNLLIQYYRNKNGEEKLLEEKEKGSKMCAEINDEGCDNYLSYSFDKTSPSKNKPKDLFPFFTKEPNANKMCDYMLFCKKDQTLYVLIIELKKGQESSSQQLQAGRTFANFIISTLRRMKQLETRRPKYRYISLRNNSKGRKNPVRPKRLKYDKGGHTEYTGTTFPLKAFLK